MPHDVSDDRAGNASPISPLAPIPLTVQIQDAVAAHLQKDNSEWVSVAIAVPEKGTAGMLAAIAAAGQESIFLKPKA